MWKAAAEVEEAMMWWGMKGMEGIEKKFRETRYGVTAEEEWVKNFIKLNFNN
jgi:hypothetical protein